ncbi:MAG: aldehyde dehydrogenase family protein, partial [Beijerinckiaceae bacterium]
VIPVPTSHLNYVCREPFGVVAQITPWNAPLFTAGWQIAPALAAGNAVVLKQSEWTPLSSLVLGCLISGTDAPSGLVNVLTGLGETTGATLIANSGVKQVVFVGSVATGRKIGKLAGELLKPVILELGGKSANIVFPDADLGRALRGAQAAIFSGAGQSCVAGSRLLLHRSIHDSFVERLAYAAGRLRLGDPMDPETEIGPIIMPGHRSWVDGMVDEALSDGAFRRTGVSDLGVPSIGSYYAPTVLDGVTPAMDIFREEVFGPVVAVTTFDEESEAVTLANDSNFGLAGAVWTGDPARGHRIASAVRVGTFWINGYKSISVMSPFGGFGHSGYGRSSGREALMAYTTTKSVWVETGASPARGFGYD